MKTEFTSIRDANGNLTKTAIKDYSYDKNGNVTSVAEYDWVDYASVPRGGGALLPTGIPGNAVLKRRTTNSLARSTPDASDSSSSHADSYWNSTSPSLRNAIASSEVSNGSATLSRAEFFYDNPATTGNLTQQKSWDSTKGGYSNPLSTANSVSASTQYNQYGSPILSTDAKGYQTELYYGNVGGVTDLYPTQTKTAYQTSVQRTETREYDFSTGLVTRSTDMDNNVSTSTAYDVFGRPTLVRAAENKPEETRTKTDYSDVDRRVIVKSDLNTMGDEKLVTIQHYDQLGRIRLTRQLEDAATQSADNEQQGIKVQTRYVVSNPCQPNNTLECLNDNASVLGSYQLVSNPYRAAYSYDAGGEGTMGWTRSKTNNGGRVIEVQTFGGASLPGPWGANTTSSGTVITAYDANFITVTDQAGKLRRSMTSGLGQLLRVDEPDSAGSLGTTTSPTQATSYTYDALSNLTQVAQGSQTRTFVYSSLGRLSSANNPESGTVSYQYDNNGNLTKKTDALGVYVDYVYDALNRNTTRNYSDITPDITYTYDASGVTNSKGRLTSVSSSVSATNYTAYDALGRMTAGNQVTDGQTYAMSHGYNRAGAQTSMTYPTGRVIETKYDVAGRMAGVKDQQSGIYYAGAVESDATNRIQYAPHGAVKVMKLGNGLWEHTDFNNRLQSTQIGLGTSGTDSSTIGLTYNYGTTNNNGNVQSVSYAGGGLSYTQTFGYDHLNRLTTSVESGTSWSHSNSYDRYGNRSIVGAALTATYGSLQQYYDGDRLRGKKLDNGTTTYYLRSSVLGGQVIAEINSSGTFTRGYVYLGGQLLAVQQNSQVSWVHQDPITKSQRVTNSSGTVVSTIELDPWGGETNRSSNEAFQPKKFTSYERDANGSDDAMHRRYNRWQSRFDQPDPYDGSYDATDRQS